MKSLIPSYAEVNSISGNANTILYLFKNIVKKYYWAENYNAEQAIIFLSNFNTDKNCDRSLNPNDIYRDWNWILVRNKNGKWILKTWGEA